MTKLLNFLKRKKTLEERIKQIQAGETVDRNNLIQEYIPFIRKNLSTHVGKYVEQEDDIYSIGLMAFNEAIDKYREERGSFLAFATLLIKSRGIDYLRKQGKYSKEVYLSQIENKQEEGYHKDHLIEVDSFEAKIEAKTDMIRLIKEMKAFGVSMDDLIKEAPKHYDTRLNAIKVGKHIYNNPILRDKLIENKQVPINDVISQVHISKKAIQRSRKFIIAVVLILNSNLDTIKEYIEDIERRG